MIKEAKHKIDNFHSPTYGVLNLNQVLEKIISFIKKEPESKYRLIIGTDSQPKRHNGADFVTALIVHRVGGGGIYFWQGKHEPRPFVLRDRIYMETTLSIDMAQRILSIFQKEIMLTYDLEIHVDVGSQGETREIIQEVVGMVRGMGFKVFTKPEAFGAYCVADRHT